MKRLSRVALAAAAIALIVPVSGCAALLSSQQTATYKYGAGDGAFMSIGGVNFRGVLLIANEDNSSAQLFYTIVNNSNGPADVTLSVGDYNQSVSLAKGEVFAQNPQNPTTETAPAIVNNLGVEAGELVDVNISANGMKNVVRAQVLNGDLWYYEQLQPTGAASGQATEAP